MIAIVDGLAIQHGLDPDGADVRAAYGSSFTSWDDATRERVRQTMVGIYELFLDRIAQGRNMPADKIRPHAQGRIWSGEQGKDLGLVDRIGGLADAIARARELGELDERAPVVVEGGAESIIQSLLLGHDAEADTERVKLALWQAEARRSPLWRKLPPELRVFAAACSPLADGETTVAALPFGLIVR